MEVEDVEIRLVPPVQPRKEAERHPASLRERRCELSCLHRAEGSVALSQGNTVVWVAVYGPGDLKSSRQLMDRAVVDVNFKTKIGTMVQNPAQVQQETFLRDVCSAAIQVRQFPRTQISLTIQELQTDGGVLATAVNACCLALLDAGVPMRHIFSAVNAAINPEGRILLDPEAKQEAEAKALLLFVFEQTNRNEIKLTACNSEGEFTLQKFTEARRLAEAAAGNNFKFFRDAIEKKYSTDRKPTEMTKADAVQLKL